MTRLRVMLEYLHPWTNDAGFYAAAGAGHYEDAGLDVEIVVGDPLRGDALAHVARQEADFAVCPSNRLLARRDRGQALRGIAAINHRGLETIQTVTDTGITRLRDLEGRRVALNPTPRGVAMVRHLVRTDGGDPDALVIIDSGVRELSVDDIAAGETDATFGGYWAWDALFGAVEPERRLSWPADAAGGLRYHSYLLATRDSVIEERPDVVAAFLRASESGYLAAGSDPDHTLATLERVIPYFPRSVLRRSLELIAPTWTESGRWGEQRPALLEGYSRWLAENDVLASPDIWRDAVTNAFVAGLPG
jgi:putative hydroxymethylpyrimidine transport system substrate-binding protein